MIKVRDVAFVRFAAPDLGEMERFLVDFGLSVAARDGERIHARGTDPSPWLHETVLGEPGFHGVGFEAASAGDLERAAALDGASPIQPLDGPGGGYRVRFTDPDGFHVEVVHGRAPADPLPVRGAAPFNRGSARVRFGRLQRIPTGPAVVKRLGHVVLQVTDFHRSEAWYKSRFGFLTSDEVRAGEHVLTAFMRCDRGADYTDHHTLLCVGLGQARFDHAAFEVEDVDAVMTGHDHLARAGWTHHAGVGRHVLGSQVFDYWKDPWGRVLEHFTDGDLLNVDHPTGYHEPPVLLGTQWGVFLP
jgi:catechol 2,3-dioxygenase-like lactoylglutathione lyase family enzyme